MTPTCVQFKGHEETDIISNTYDVNGSSVGIECAHEPRSPAKPNRQLTFPLWSDNSTLSPERLLSKEHHLPCREPGASQGQPVPTCSRGRHSDAKSLGNLHLLQFPSPGSSLMSCWVQETVELNSNLLLACLLLYSITIHEKEEHCRSSYPLPDAFQKGGGLNTASESYRHKIHICLCESAHG